jgi:hypothetical protein
MSPARVLVLRRGAPNAHLGLVDAHLGLVNGVPGGDLPLVVTATLGGRVQVKLIVDSGSDITAVRPDRLTAAGIDLSRPASRGEATVSPARLRRPSTPSRFPLTGTK